MNATTVRIVDYGRGPQIADHRLTVMDVFYYLHRGHDFEFIHRAMPSLTREQFDAVVDYINDHRVELVDADRRIEERNVKAIAAQTAKGLRPELDESLSVAERAARLKEKLHRRLTEQEERNGDPTSH